MLAACTRCVHTECLSPCSRAHSQPLVLGCLIKAALWVVHCNNVLISSIIIIIVTTHWAQQLLRCLSSNLFTLNCLNDWSAHTHTFLSIIKPLPFEIHQKLFYANETNECFVIRLIKISFLKCHTLILSFHPNHVFHFVQFWNIFSNETMCLFTQNIYRMAFA